MLEYRRMTRKAEFFFNVIDLFSSIECLFNVQLNTSMIAFDEKHQNKMRWIKSIKKDEQKKIGLAFAFFELFSIEVFL